MNQQLINKYTEAIKGLTAEATKALDEGNVRLASALVSAAQVALKHRQRHIDEVA